MKDGTSKFVPIDESAARHDHGVAIHGDIQPFRSPVDGSIISDRKQLEEHNKRNNVVSANEFTPEFYERKARERADFYEGKRSREQIRADRQEIYENMIRAEREAGW
jgi:hypothetical protein